MGPTPVLAVLGIELDYLAQVARLPDEKLQALKELIHSRLPRKMVLQARTRITHWPFASCG